MMATWFGLRASVQLAGNAVSHMGGGVVATTPHFGASRSSGFWTVQLWTCCLSRSRRLRCVRVVGRPERAFGGHVFRFSHRRRYWPQLLHGPRWLARGILQVHSSASVQSATARDEGASRSCNNSCVWLWMHLPTCAVCVAVTPHVRCEHSRPGARPMNTATVSLPAGRGRSKCGRRLSSRWTVPGENVGQMILKPSRH